MSIDIEGMEAVFKKLGKFETLRIMEEPMERSVRKIEYELKEYPSPPAPGEWAAKTHPAQKRAFFALLRAGLIKGKRTGTQGRRWTVKIDRTADSLEGHVGNNNESYGPFVQSKRFQARFHRGRWKTDQQVVDELRREIVDDFQDTARKVINS